MKKVLKFILYAFLGIITFGLFFIGYAIYQLYKETKFDADKIKALPAITAVKIFGIALIGIFIMFTGYHDDGVENNQAEQQKQEVKKETKVTQVKEEKEKKSKEEIEAEKEDEYRELAGNLINRVGLAMDLVGRGFTAWGQGKEIGRNQVVQGLKELNNEVKELDNLEPAKSQQELHKEIKKLVTGYRDIVEKALKAGDNNDAETLLECTKELDELNKNIILIMAKVKTD